MTITLINTGDEVLKHALTKPLTPSEWDQNAEIAGAAAKLKKGEGAAESGEVVRH